MFKTVGLGCIVYAAIAALFFGSLSKPVFLVSVWSDRLGAPYWFWIVVAWIIVGATSFLIPTKFSIARCPTFVAITCLGSLLSVGAYADYLRSKAVTKFGADRSVEHTFWQSARHAPEEFQFFLHAAAMKGCVPFAWSYRTMSFYRLSSEAAINVLPADWLIQCPSIKHDLHEPQQRQL